MVELVATTTMTIGSALLFGYWFRFACLLILSTKTARDHTRAVAVANRLEFLEIQSQLHHPRADLERLRRLLDRDYAVLTSLLKDSSDCSPMECKTEMRMLKINYCLVSLRYELSRRFSMAAAARALKEMSLVVEYFANAMGERAMCTGQ
jgi:hypothetical protein